MRKIILTIVAVAALAFPAAVIATPGGGYGSQPGYGQSLESSTHRDPTDGCSDHGSFGFYGDKGTQHDVRGGSGSDTGDNNGGFCGLKP